MRRARPWIILACAALVMSGVGLHPAGVWAQAPPLEGVYLTQKRFLNGVEQAIPAGFPRRLWLLRGGEYVWGTYRDEFRVTSAGRVIQLICHWTGDVTLPGRSLRFEFVHSGVVQQYLLEPEGSVETVPPPIPLPAKKGCPSSGAVSDRLVAGAGWQVLPATLQAQAGARRTVDGELLLALKSPSAAADTRLWACLVTRGLPAVEFVEPGAAVQEAFVWPDARFRTELRGGVTYEWHLRSSGCDTAARQRGGTLRGPTDAPPAEEKVVVACFVSEGQFSNCQGWWLIRP